MQSDAFPTPPIYSHHFQPRLLSKLPEQEASQPDSDLHLNQLLNEVELLITECSSEESQAFWSATNRIKIKHQVIESMQKIESLFLDIARESTQDPELISAVAEGLLYTSSSHSTSPNHAFRKLDIPQFLKHQIC
jgi:hypothetical protein